MSSVIGYMKSDDYDECYVPGSVVGCVRSDEYSCMMDNMLQGL